MGERVKRLFDRCAVCTPEEPQWGQPYTDALQAEVVRLREQLDAARQAVDAAEPGMSIPPADCTNNCMDGPCDCSGKRRVTAWVIDVPRLRAALGVEGPQPDERVDLERPQPPQGVSAVGRTTRKADTGAGFHPATRPASEPPGVEGPAAGDGQP